MPSSSAITVLGLGNMGKALVKTYSKAGSFEVHAWNRGEANRKAVQDMHLDNVTIHKDLSQAIQASEIIIMTVLGDPELSAANQVIQQAVVASSEEDDDDSVWKGRILVQFTTQNPISIGHQEKLISSYGAELVGGAMECDPTIVGTDDACFFISANKESNDALDKVKLTIDVLGNVIVFRKDIGCASLMDIGVLGALFFGLVGFENSVKLMVLYGASKDFQDQFVEQAKQLIPPYTAHIYGGMTKAIQTKGYREFGQNYYSALSIAGLVENMLSFMKHMGMQEEEHFVASYLKALKKVPGSRGSCEVVEVYLEKGKQQDL